MAYPVYMTIGNIPKEIRRKPSHQGQILLGYLPTTKLDHITSDASRRRTLANLFHACMNHILEPIEDIGVPGLPLTSGIGVVYHAHPIFAAFVGDYMEQILVTGVKFGECPQCDIDHNLMGEDDENHQLRDMDSVLDALELFDVDPVAFTKACKACGIKPIIGAFWKKFPYANIFRSITPDLLHQGYQGLIKHLISWLKAACGEAELDARCRRLPPNHNIRLFTKGISHLARVTGKEHNQICRFLLGIIIGIQLPRGLSSSRLICAVRGALDFLYLAQYPCHTTETLQLLDDALKMFKENKDIFIHLGIRSNFKIMKLHFFCHYRPLIELFGTIDGYNTENTERLYIDLAKDAYNATNHKDEYWQMVLWLERKEKIIRHSKFMKWRISDRQISQSEKILPSMERHWILKMTKHPSVKAVTINSLISDYGAIHFREALARYVAITANPGLTQVQLERAAEQFILPTKTLSIYHRIKFIDLKTSQTADAVHVQPAKTLRHNRKMQARFDTVLVNDGSGTSKGTKGLLE
jgi:hypothetical protein